MGNDELIMWVDGFTVIKKGLENQPELNKEYDVNEENKFVMLNNFNKDVFDDDYTLYWCKAFVNVNTIEYCRFCEKRLSAIGCSCIKKIVLKSEINIQEEWASLVDLCIPKTHSWFIDSLKSLISFYADPFQFSVEKIKKILIEHGYSESFSTILSEDYGRYYTTDIGHRNKINLAVALAEEGVSTDMRAYLLVK